MKKFVPHVRLLLCCLIVCSYGISWGQAPSTHNLILRAQQKLSKAVQFPTISAFDTGTVNFQAFHDLHQHLQASFPLVHARLKRTVVNGYSLLYEWPGTAPDLEPIMLYAHQDVVPVETEAGEVWEHPPFSGAIADGYLWGRGALDDKYRVIAALEAVERLLEMDWQPRRGIFLAFGHDEEVNGWQGARSIADTLLARGQHLACVLDEGPGILQDMLPDVNKAFALVGMAEKGSLNLELIVNAPGGHSSMPPDQTAIGILAQAIHRLQSNPFPARLLPLMKQSLQAMAPYTDGKTRLGLNNINLFRKQVLRTLDEDQVTSAVIRTKLSPNIISGGASYNVLPKLAKAVVNIRLLQGDSIAHALAYVTQVIDDPRVVIRKLGRPVEPSPVSRTDTEMFRTLKSTIEEMYPDVVVAPTLLPAGTDSKHFTELSDNLYRFIPAPLTRDDGARLHSTNERISLEALEQVIQFYTLFLQKAA